MNNSLSPLIWGLDSCFFPELPFLWSPLENSAESHLPLTLPFMLQESKEGVLCQAARPEVLAALDAAYLSGSHLIGLMDETGIGRKYGDDFERFILEEGAVDGKRILEIGCGTGYLLHRLRSKGATVLGYEPGFASLGKFDVPVVQSYFPSPHIGQDRFDIIVAYAVLEHVVDVPALLQAVASSLAPDGRFILAVPDCTFPIMIGDISMLIHEHFSYFEENSLEHTLRRACFLPARIEQSRFGGSIYCSSSYSPESINIPVRNPRSYDFFSKAQDNVYRLRELLSTLTPVELGIYVPTRCLNMLFFCRDVIRDRRISLRFFDDSRELHETFLPCFDVPIESEIDLVSAPPANLLIASYTFGDAIEKRLREKQTLQTKFYQLRDLLMANR